MKTRMAMITAVAMLGLASMADAQTFTSTNVPILIPGVGTSGPAAPYPSTVAVAGMAAGPWDLNVNLTGLSHTFPDDIEMLLVGPAGNVMLLSDAGGSADIVGIAVTFSDGSPLVTDAGPLLAGTFGPTNHEGIDVLPAPAPVGPHGTSLNALAAGAAGTINGTWSLFVSDNTGGDIGSLAGWSLTFAAIPSPGALALLGVAGVVGGRRRRR